MTGAAQTCRYASSNEIPRDAAHARHARISSQFLYVRDLTSDRPKACLTLLPIGCTSVATTGNRSTARPARRMGDLCRQVSWLTARAFLSGLPGIQRGSSVAYVEETRRLQLRAQPRDRCCSHLTVFPLSHHTLARMASPSQSLLQMT